MSGTLRLHKAIQEAILELIKADKDGALMAVTAAFVGVTVGMVAQNGGDGLGEIVCAFDDRKITIHAKEQAK